MKLAKFAFVCAAAVSVSAMADDVSNTIGLLKVNNVNNLRTIPVGINFAAADGGAVSVSNAVKTAGLPEGTLLYAYSKTDGKYYIYSIVNNAWTSNTKYYINSEGDLTEEQTVAANAMLLPAGTAAFLKLPDELPDNKTPQDYNVITAGKPVTSAAGLSDGANLCCFPVGKAVNLNTDTTDVAKLISSPTATTFSNDAKTAVATQGDTIVVLTADTGASRMYYYDGENWGYIGRAPNAWAKSFITTDATIPGGLGFWYNKVSSGN